MTLHDFFLGGSLLRVAMFGLGLAYCVKFRQLRSLAALAHLGSMVVLMLIVFSREWATLVGIPVTALIVWLLTDQIHLKRQHSQLRAIVEDQHAINEQLVAQLERNSRPV